MGKRRGLEKADAVGVAAQKKPRSVCPHNRQRSQCKECGDERPEERASEGTKERERTLIP